MGIALDAVAIRAVTKNSRDDILRNLIKREKLLRENGKGAVAYIGGSNNTYWDEDFWWAVGTGVASANPFSIDLALLGTPKTSAIILAAIPPIGPPNAVPNVGATAPTIFFNISFITIFRL